MKLTKCIKYATAQVVVTAKDKVYTFTLFDDVIKAIIQLEGVIGQNIAEKLLSATNGRQKECCA